MLRTVPSNSDPAVRSHNRRSCTENLLSQARTALNENTSSLLLDANGQVPGNGPTAHANRLKLRKSRFRGAAVPARNLTPQAHAGDSGDFAYDADAMEDVDSPPLKPRSQSGTSHCQAQGGNDVLQEISNSSMRRRKKAAERDSGSLFRKPKQSCVSPTDTRNPAAAYSGTGTQSTEATLALLDPKATSQTENKAPRHARNRAGKSAATRRSTDHAETAQYIEHLEYQLAAMETQLTSIGSPSSIESQAAKLKSLNVEAKMLRQEVSDWEEKFHERIQEQVQEHEITVRGLRAQIKSLQRSAESADARFKEVEAEAEAMKKQAYSTDRLNQELERRVEFMSELLATSPTKLGFDDAIWTEPPVRRSPTRPTSRILPVSSASRLSICNSRTSGSPNRQSRPGSPILGCGSGAEEQNPFDCLVHHGAIRAASADLDSEISEQTLINDSCASPNHLRCITQCMQSDGETKMKPARRMRRFYTGSTGPRALILPNTTHSAPFAASAPTTAAPTPSATEPLLEEIARPSTFTRNNSTPSRPHTLPSDLLINEDAATTPVFEDKISTLTEDSTFAIPSPEIKTLHDLGEGVDKTESGGDESMQSFPSRPSTASVQGETLFQELTRLKSDNDYSDASNTKPPTPFEPRVPPDIHAASDDDIHPSQFSSNKQPYDPGGTTPPGSAHRDLLELPFPLRILGRLTAAASRSIDQQAPRIKFLLANAWSMLALSRPVLEFRWWLVKLLLGGLQKRKPPPLALQGCNDIASSKSPSTGSRSTRSNDGFRTPDLAHRRRPPRLSLRRNVVESNDIVWDIFETREEYKHATPPPVSWFKFGITLVFAVGIAIKDGPATLFGGGHRARPRGRQRDRMADFGALDSDSDGDCD